MEGSEQLKEAMFQYPPCSAGRTEQSQQLKTHVCVFLPDASKVLWKYGLQLSPFTHC